jgi:class 3 adenylate cyclase
MITTVRTCTSKAPGCPPPAEETVPVIDTFNVAARVEQLERLTKTTGDAILLTHPTVDAVDGRPPD